MNPSELSITLIGYGRAGRTLALGLHSAGAKIVNVGEHPDSNRVAVAIEDGFRVFPTEHVEPDVDLLILAVPDTEVRNVAEILAESASKSSVKRKQQLERGKSGEAVPTAVHLSGRLGLEPLEPLASQGFAQLAWHPIQTFPQVADPGRFHGITAGFTADPQAKPTAKVLADMLGTELLEVPEDRRIDYHLASVMASNFLPLLLDLGAERLRGIAPDRPAALRALWPLVAGMTESLGALPPEVAMTGPVVRGDLAAVKAHLNVLPPEMRGLYSSLTLALADLARLSGRMSDEQVLAWARELGGGNGRSEGKS